jgi:dimeric dUTPase (all-alpha-NTP-PPase superfamily)
MWQDIYNINKELDKIFMEKYKDVDKYYEKNVIELIVELSEFANEIKCFKYWSIKSMNKEEALEEYADCITMALSFYTTYNIDLEVISHSNTNDILDLFNILFTNASKLYNEKNEILVKQIFSDILYLGDLLGFSLKEKYDACYKKMDIIKQRLESNY